MATAALGRVYHDGEVVVRQGGRDGCMHVVQEGRVEILVEKDGREVCLAVRGAGEVIGEMAILSVRQQTALGRIVRSRYTVRVGDQLVAR